MTIIEEIQKLKEKADKWDNLMTHTKYENTFGCAYFFELKEANRRNQFLQSENEELKNKLVRMEK